MMSGVTGFTMPSITTLNIVTQNPYCGSWLLLRRITFIKPLCLSIDSSASFANSSPRSLFDRNRQNMKQ